jgi:hypothetical protein
MIALVPKQVGKKVLNSNVWYSGHVFVGPASCVMLMQLYDSYGRFMQAGYHITLGTRMEVL